MSEPIPFDEHAERLKIRSSPKPVTRINRKVLMVGAGLGVLADAGFDGLLVPDLPVEESDVLAEAARHLFLCDFNSK